MDLLAKCSCVHGMFISSDINMYCVYQVQALNMTLTDTAAKTSELQELCKQLQRSLTSSEHDRRVLQDKLDSTR